jgi:hypothetical protein
MAEHSHEIIAHLYHVQLPYRMSGTELEFEPHAENSANWHRQLTTMMQQGYSEEEVRRIFVGAVALLQKYPHRSLGEALDTAMVWERG